MPTSTAALSVDRGGDLAADRLDRFRHLLGQGEGGLDRAAEALVEAMEEASLETCGALAAIFAQHMRRHLPDDAATGKPWAAGRTAALSAAKLRHDWQQLGYLRDRVLDAARADRIAGRYREALGAFAGLDGEARLPWSSPAGRLVASERIFHVRPSPRVESALSSDWDRRQVARQYLQRSPSLVVIDDFLSADALEELRAFCLESTVWSGNRYPNGRLSALLFAGFNSPLLMQIAEEIRDSLPEVIGPCCPLRQLWGFKYTEKLPPASTAHADFAAVNVNFWITPEAANRDPASGGMVVYDLEASADWNFADYNQRLDLITDHIRARRPRAIRIPYRQNRAILFNSALFHETEAVDFDEDYESHRINVTMLYGDRREGIVSPTDRLGDRPAWRSRSLRGRRR